VRSIKSFVFLLAVGREYRPLLEKLIDKLGTSGCGCELEDLFLAKILPENKSDGEGFSERVGHF